MVVTPSIGIVTKENIKDLGLNMIQSGYNHTKFNGEIDIIRPFGPFTHPPNSSDFFSFFPFFFLGASSDLFEVGFGARSECCCEEL